MEVHFLKPHLAINVRDVPASIDFYSNLFGVAPAKVRTGYAKFDVTNPPLNFTLNQHAFQDAGALSHLGFQVASTEDVLAIRQQWLERGLVTRDEMQTNCCYATQDKTWVKDPDGNEWEVFVVLKDNLPEEPANTETVSCVTTLHNDHALEQAGASCGCVECGCQVGKMRIVIFACVHNAGRSQMAAAFFNQIANGAKAQAVSAGTEPGVRVHPEVLAVMQEVGIDLSHAKPQKLTQELANDASLLITMGCGDKCPYVPGLRRDDWPLRDPKGLPMDDVRRIRDEVKQRVIELVDREELR